MNWGGGRAGQGLQAREMAVCHARGGGILMRTHVSLAGRKQRVGSILASWESDRNEAYSMFPNFSFLHGAGS